MNSGSCSRMRTLFKCVIVVPVNKGVFSPCTAHRPGPSGLSSQVRALCM